MVVFILFQGPRFHQRVHRRCHCTISHFSWLESTRGHSYLLGPSLQCVTIRDVDLVPTIEEYDCSLFFTTPLVWVYWLTNRPCYPNRLVDLLGLKTLIVSTLTQHGSSLGGSLPFNFLTCRFNLAECPTTYPEDFVDLGECWTSCWCQAFMIAFFVLIFFPS